MNREVRLIVTKETVEDLVTMVEFQKNISRTLGHFDKVKRYESVQRQLEDEKERLFT